MSWNYCLTSFLITLRWFLFRTPLSSKIMISAAKTKIRVRKITRFILMDEGPLCCPIPIWPQKIWNSGEGKSNLPHLRIRCNQKSNRFSDFSHWLVCLRRLCCWKSTFSFSRKLGSEVFRIHHQVFSLQRGPFSSLQG